MVKSALIEAKNLLDFYIESTDDLGTEQIEKTIDFDCKTKYHDEGLAKIELELLTLNASEIRKDMIAKAKKDFEYNTKNYNEDVERCDKSNQWVSDFVGSLA